MAKNKLPPLPKVLRVGSYEYPLTMVPRGHQVFNDEPGAKPEETDGITHFHAPPGRGIWIADDQAPRDFFETVWHEVTHAVNDAAYIEDKGGRVNINEEDVASRHGRLWTQLLIDNPQFQRWLVGMLAYLRGTE